MNAPSDNEQVDWFMAGLVLLALLLVFAEGQSETVSRALQIVFPSLAP